MNNNNNNKYNNPKLGTLLKRHCKSGSRSVVLVLVTKLAGEITRNVLSF